MSIEVEYNYDSDKHFAPPIRIQWVARNQNRLTQERWIFIHCCGGIGYEKRSNVISSEYSCKSAKYEVPVTKFHHVGRLNLLRTSHNQVVTRTPPLAKWSCCEEGIPRWDDAWSSRDGRIPFDLVDSGCLEGMYDCDAESASVPRAFKASTFALIAKPLKRKPKTHACAGKTASHASSGLQTVLIEKDKVMNPFKIGFTQKSVLKQFSDKSLPSVLETAVLILKCELKVEEVPTIRVATRSNSEDDEFFTCDNRRLFLFKMLGIEEVNVDWIQWTSEFDDKLDQNIRFDPETRFNATKDDILACRDECYFNLLIEGDSNEIFQIPTNCVGYIIGSEGNTIKRLCLIFGANIGINQYPISSLLCSVLISRKKKARKAYQPVAAKKTIVKMVVKLLDRKQKVQKKD